MHFCPLFFNTSAPVVWDNAHIVTSLCHFDTGIIHNKTKTIEKCVLFLITHSALLNKAPSTFKKINFKPLILFRPVSRFLSDTVCTNSLPISMHFLYFLFHSISVCLCLFLSIYVPLLSSVYFLSLLSALCSVQFLISFANVYIHFYWLSSVAQC